MAYEINATSRNLQGTSASRRLRRAGGLPGIVYGADKAAVSIKLEHNTLYYALQQEDFHSSIITLILDGEKQDVLIRDVQYHPWKRQVLHIDFQRVSTTEKINIYVPLHFLNEESAPGVKLGGGTINHLLNEVEITCLAASLPKSIDLDVSQMQLGQTLHLSDIPLNKGIELAALVRGENLGVVSINLPKNTAAEGSDSTSA